MRRWFWAQDEFARPCRVDFKDLGERAPGLYITKYECGGKVILSGFDADKQPMTAEARFETDYRRLMQFNIFLPRTNLLVFEEME